MGYDTRVLGSHDLDIHIDELIKSLAADGLTVKFEFDPTEETGNWLSFNQIYDMRWVLKCI